MKLWGMWREQPAAPYVAGGGYREEGERRLEKLGWGYGDLEGQPRAGWLGGRKKETALAVGKSQEAVPQTELAEEGLAVCLE